MGKSQIQSWWADLPTETLAETAWERQMNLLGIEAYEQSRYDSRDRLRPASETASGQRAIRSVLNHAIDEAEEAIMARQREMVMKHRVDQNLKATVLVVPAETCALIVVKTLIDQTFSATDPDIGANFQLICKKIGKAIELELNFRTWIEASKESARAYAQSKGTSKVPKSLAEKLIEEEGAEPRTIRKWRRTFKELSTYKWEDEELFYCGSAMALAVIEALPEYFTLETIMLKGLKKDQVKMTPSLQQKLADGEQRAAHLNVVRKPMLSKPRPWTKSD